MTAAFAPPKISPWLYICRIFSVQKSHYFAKFAICN